MTVISALLANEKEFSFHSDSGNCSVSKAETEDASSSKILGCFPNLVEKQGTEMMMTALAHEIKNPAALAMAYTNLIRQSRDFAEIDNFCHLIQQALIDISDLVQELLFATQHELEPCTINVTVMLDEMISEYRAALPGITFSFDAKESFLTCYACEQHVRLTFSNLLKNAVEAAGSTGHIIVYATSTSRYLQVTIRNSRNIEGHAIEPKPFSSGMGLGICYWLTEQIGGKLEIKDDANGECVVIVSLPCSM